MILKSTAFANNASIPAKYTCEGVNIHPPLEFTGLPAGTMTLALIVEDIDAPNGIFTHWILVNIPEKVTNIEEGVIPATAIEGKNDFQTVGYSGPCPPSGKHRYYFRLYALDTVLPLTEGVSKEEVTSMLSQHTIDKTELVGLFFKPE